jgi:hypothetical protein
MNKKINIHNIKKIKSPKKKNNNLIISSTPIKKLKLSPKRKINHQDINLIEKQIQIKKHNNNNTKINNNNNNNTKINNNNNNNNNKINKKVRFSNKNKIYYQKPFNNNSKSKSIKKDKKRSNKKSNKRSNNRFNKNNSNKSSYSMKKVENKIKEIRNKKTTDIKSELEKNGIKVSGKSDTLLRDIYFYSKVCNINIKHEK